MPRTSILLLTKNDAGNTEACLNAIYSQQGADPFEVVAVDSGSTDGTLDVLRRFPLRLRQIPPDSFHHARTRNLAASFAKGEFLVFVSQDAIPASPGWLRALVANFENPTVGAVYGRQIPKPSSSVERRNALNTLYGTKRIVKDPAARNNIGFLFYHFSNANSALRRTVWQAAQFPENLKVFEDLGIAKRILDAGWKIVYEPEAPVFHSHLHSTAGLFRRYFDIGYTLRRLEIWEAPGTKTSMFRTAANVLKNNLDRMRTSDDIKSLSRGIAQDMVKSIGLLLGLHESRLPIFIKRHLSAHGVY
jgi:rhamnosyltransferase